MDVVTYALLKNDISALGTEIEGISDGFTYKGSVSSVGNLPDDASKGDMYTVSGTKYVWDGSNWVKVGMGTITADDVAYNGSAVYSSGTVGNKLSSLDTNKVPTSRTVNGKALSANVTLAPGDIEFDSAETYTSGTLGAAVAKNSEDVTQLSTAINQIVPFINFSVAKGTQYLPITISSGETYKIVNKTSNIINAYTFSTTDSSGEVVQTISTSIPSGGEVVFVALADALAIRSYINAAGEITINNLSKGIVGILADDIDGCVNKSGKREVVEQNTTFFTQNPNLYNVNDTVDDYRINQAGTDVYAAQNYNTTGYIDVSALTTIKAWFWTGTAITALSCDYVLYDANKTPLALRAASTGTINVATAAFARISISKGNKSGAMLINGDITPTSYIPYGFTFNYSDDFFVDIYPTDDVIQKLLDNKGKNIRFKSGNYDLISIYEDKFGSDYFTNYVDYTSGGNNIGRGLPVYHGTKMVFDPDVVFTAIYEGNNTAVRDNFSAFAFETGITFDGLRMTASGIRNIIHDDFDNSTIGTTIIKNCNLKHDAKNIAGGLAQHETVIIQDCSFENNAVSGTYDISYHNNVNSGAQSLLIIKDCYMLHCPRITYYGTSTLLTDVMVSNNSLGSNVIYEAENDSATVENINLKAWNNEIRT